MEHCFNCNKDFSVIGRRAEKRLEEFKAVTGQIACDSCQKKIKQQAHEEIIRDVIGEYMEKGPLTEDAIHEMIKNNDPALEKLFKEDGEENGGDQ